MRPAWGEEGGNQEPELPEAERKVLRERPRGSSGPCWREGRYGRDRNGCWACNASVRQSREPRAWWSRREPEEGGGETGRQLLFTPFFCSFTVKDIRWKDGAEKDGRLRGVLCLVVVQISKTGDGRCHSIVLCP